MTGNFILRNKKNLVFRGRGVLRGRGVYQVCWGRMSGCEEGNGILLLWEEYNEKKNERGSNINDIKAIGKNIM